MDEILFELNTALIMLRDAQKALLELHMLDIVEMPMHRVIRAVELAEAYKAKLPSQPQQNS